jgi:hypothetical protein
MAADDFTKRRFTWLDQVAADPGISGSTAKLAILIACRFLSRKTNTAWPSQPVLAELLGIRTREGVRRCVDQLVDGGHLAVEASHGRGSSNRYRIILKDVVAQNEPDEEAQPDEDPAEAAAPPKTAKSSARETLFPDDLPPAKAKAARTSAIDEAFDIWWDQYPKKVAKVAARKAYHRIVSKGEASPEELLAGLMRYAAVKTGKDPKYVKDPSGWLNDGRWADEHPPARTSDHDGFGEDRARARGSAAPAQSWTEIALGGLRDEQLD